MRRLLLFWTLAAFFSASPGLFGQSALRDAQSLMRLVGEFQRIDELNKGGTPADADAKSKKLASKLAEIAGVLKPYFPDKPGTEKANTNPVGALIQRAFSEQSENPLLQSEVVTKAVYSKIKPYVSGAGTSALPSVITSALDLPSLNIPLITDSLIRFVLDRAQEEILDAYADRFNGALLEYPELETLFPYTVNVAKAFEKRQNSVYQMVQNFPTTFLDDLKNLPSTIPKLAEMDGSSASDLGKIRVSQYAAVFQSEGFDPLLVALELIRNIQADNAPPAILHNLGEWARERIKKVLPDGPKTENEKNRKAFLASFELVALVSDSLRGEAGNWAPREDLQKLFAAGTDSDVLRMLYCGLLYEQIKQNSDLAVVKTMLLRDDADQPLQLRFMEEYLKPATVLFTKSQSLIAKLKDAQTANLGSKEQTQAYLDAVGGYLDSLIPLLQPGQMLPPDDAISDHGKAIAARFRLASSLARSGITFLKALSAKNYSVAFISLQPIFVELDLLYQARIRDSLKHLFPDATEGQKIADYVASLDFSQLPPEFTNDDKTVLKTTIGQILARLKQRSSGGSGAVETGPVPAKELREYLFAQFRSQFEEISSTVVQVGSFATALANATDAEAGQKVLESFAAPPSGYREKAKVSFSVAINTFLGLSGDISMPTNALGSSPSFGVGPWLPVGLWLGGNQSVIPLGCFVSLIEVGNLARIRMGGDNSAALPAFNPVNLISPGLFLTLLFDKGPFAFYGGVCVSPGEGAQSTVSQTASVGSLLKLQLGMAVDVPLFYLSSRP